MDIILKLGFSVFAILVVYVIYLISRNDYATTVLSREESKINLRLRKYGKYQLDEMVSFRDASPSDIRWSIIPGAKRGIPSRIVYRHLRKWWKSEDSVHLTRLYDLCQKEEVKEPKCKFR